MLLGIDVAMATFVLFNCKSMATFELFNCKSIRTV